MLSKMMIKDLWKVRGVIHFSKNKGAGLKIGPFRRNCKSAGGYRFVSWFRFILSPCVPSDGFSRTLSGFTYQKIALGFRKQQVTPAFARFCFFPLHQQKKKTWMNCVFAWGMKNSFCLPGNWFCSFRVCVDFNIKKSYI